jgi:hypothetical protein
MENYSIDLSTLEEDIVNKFKQSYNLAPNFKFQQNRPKLINNNIYPEQVPKCFHPYLNHIKEHNRWTREMIFQGVREVNYRKIDNITPEHYPNAGNQIIEALSKINISKDSKILIAGSISPWIECICLQQGYTNITTSDYSFTRIQDSRIKFVLTKDLNLITHNFDVIITFSSIEHDGLGRYGDPISPTGSFDAVNNFYHMLNKNGYLLCGIPVLSNEKINTYTIIESNYHIIFSQKDLDKLFKSFVLVDTIKPIETNVNWQRQPIFVLQKQYKEKILFCKDIWWPFGSQLVVAMWKKIISDVRGCKFLYKNNGHAAYSHFNGEIEKYFPFMSDKVDEEIVNTIDKISDIVSSHDAIEYVLDQNNQIIASKNIDNDIFQRSNWYNFYTKNENYPIEYRSKIIKKFSTPSEFVGTFLKNHSFLKRLSELNGKYIAIHIRWTDKVKGIAAETEFYDVDTYLNNAINLRKKTGINTVVLVCDNIDAVNSFNKLNSEEIYKFDVIYDTGENLPENKWYNSTFQRSSLNVASKHELHNDLLNGFKIYQILFNATAIIGNFDSNMCAAPATARNSDLDINITGRGLGRWTDNKEKWTSRENRLAVSREEFIKLHEEYCEYRDSLNKKNDV